MSLESLQKWNGCPKASSPPAIVDLAPLLADARWATVRHRTRRYTPARRAVSA